ncbi:MAG: response regulator [Deltaproteobacteria bacterium]|nr:response regulator [Deltaproteobacteria bacterium]
MTTNAKPKIRVRIWDQMVLIGLGLALFYTVFESVLFIFLKVDVDMMQRLFGPGMSSIWGRLTILCLFLIFGSHAQYTINQRKQAESALRESEARFRLIVENAPVGYFELDLQGGFVFFNDAACRILGFPAGEMEGMHHRDIVGEASRDRIDAAFAQVLETGDTARSIDWVLIRKDAAKRFVESSISLLMGDHKGRPAGFSVFLHDVTDRKRSEALRQAKLAAEATSRSKGEFLASMSHEIRTPLNAVIGLVDLMLASDLRTDQREDLDVVRSSAYALLSIINNVLDFSKIEAGRLELDPAAFGFEQFLDESLKIMAMKAHSKGIELACRLAPDVPDRLVGDLTRFRQVMLNLVDNAIKFTARGEVVVSVIRRALTETEVTLQVTVTDTGIGIAPDTQRRIFKAYDQGDPSVSRRYGGTGLGLAVSAQLVHLMGGRIGVKSVPGKGSAFGFTAVFGRPPQAPPQTAPALWPGLDGKTVLVVDDNAAARRISEEILARAGMSVRLAAGAEEALQVLGQTGPGPDFVLLDSDMPGADGFDLAARLRRQVPAARVVMMLTFAHLRRKPECADLGVGATVIKPFGPGELLNALGRAASGVGLAIAPPAATPPAAQPGRALTVLVAEDTAFNQKFILRLLERWGHVAVLAEDGRKAVAAFSAGRFDIVFMDVQMPEMDGLEAARAIRRVEETRGGRTPIIAMTAHAIMGDRERCLAAGMDDYLPKPIDSEKLRRMMNRLVPDPGVPTALAGGAAPSRTEDFLKAFENDWEFFKEVVEVFCADYPNHLAALRRAAAAADAPALMRPAHSLKGMLSNFQAAAAAERAFALEKMGRAGVLDGAGPLIDALAEDLDSLEKELHRVLVQARAGG